ncbi:MAG: DUF4114 domain-containing protein [Leptolyngbyaceae cyanobacterium RM2_2_4]|nr:DUF4114 domain-containing protein [Leptolyngbyaceae cyanobacterium SM1_4_3]NJO52433.1 DUF4114 domain-containing protein [Leptolyngbyaceae cyanobacterium RM2_2_4]NJO66387.1 DUF4114 domain-containing protein [Leptolyngbyaceae cyanobacterium RM1_405_57]
MAIITVTTTADSGSGSLREAISKAQSGDTVKFNSSLTNKTITLNSQITILNNITIDGSGAGDLSISGGDKTRLFGIGKRGNKLNVTIKNLTLRNGRSISGSTTDNQIGQGGAIRIHDYSDLVLENTVLKNNVGERGGAVYSGYGSSVTARNSVFENNDGSISKDGFSAGAIAAQGEGGGEPEYDPGNGFVKIENSVLRNNKGHTGGAIYVLHTPLTIDGSVLENNKGNGGGGAVFTDGVGGTENSLVGRLNIRNSRISDNTSQGQGGGLFLWLYGDDEVVIENSTIEANKVVRGGDFNDSKGGGIRVGGSGGKVSIRGTTIANNVAQQQGGGIWTDANTVTIEGSTFSGNQVKTVDGKGDIGGAMVLNVGQKPVRISHSTFVGNYADRDSGAIWTGSSNNNITLSNSVFADNFAGTKKQGAMNFQPKMGSGNIVELTKDGLNNTGSITYLSDLKLSGLQEMRNRLVHIPLTGSPAIRTGKDAGAYDVGSQTPLPPPREEVLPVSESPTVPDNGSTPTPPDSGQPTSPPDSGTPTLPDPIAPKPLVAKADVITTKANTAVKIDVLANDQIAGDFTLAIGDRPTSGTVTLDNNGTLNDLTDDFIQYTPETDVAGEDSFTYRLSRNGESVSTTVKVTVTEEPSSESPLPDNPLPSNPLPNNPLPEVPTPEVPTPEVLTPEVLTPEVPTPEAPTPVQPQPNLFTQTKLIDLRNVDLDNNSELDSQVAAEFGEISSNAAYNNSAGLYVVADESGAVVDPDSDQLIRPGETGYAEAALKQRVAGAEFNRTTGELSTVLETGALLAPYLVSNGTADQFLSQNPSNLQNSDSLNAFFAFGVANPDQKTHVKLLNDNTFVFEDKLGGGDQDFNDFAFKLNVQGAA